MKDLTQYLTTNILEALFPDRCACGKLGVPLCPDCQAKIVVTKTDLCPVCKKVSAMGRTCSGCRHKSKLTGVMIVGPHDGLLKDSIWRLKYSPLRSIVRPLAKEMVSKYGGFIRRKNFVVTYVPVSKRRLHERGYNQAQLLAVEVAKDVGLEVVEGLERTHDVPHQVGLRRKQRLKNTMGSVAYVETGIAKDRRILVVDDVYTTGATLEECSRVLREAGFREVWALVLSRD